MVTAPPTIFFLEEAIGTGDIQVTFTFFYNTGVLFDLPISELKM